VFGEIPDCMFLDVPVRLSDSGHAHITRESFNPMTLCDMIINNIPCPKKNSKRRFRQTSVELCATRKGKIYRIILDKEYTRCIDSFAYVVNHVEPI